MAANRDDKTQQHNFKSSLGLVAHFTGIEIEGEFGDNAVNVGRGRFVVVHIDDQECWKSKKLFRSSPLRWQEDYRVSFRPSSCIKVEVLRQSMLSVMFPDKQHVIGRASGRLVDLLDKDADLVMTDASGIRLDGIKIKIKLTLISDSPRDLMGRVDAAISRLDDSVLSQISKHIDALSPMTKVAYSSTQAVFTCIPSLGQTVQAIVKIARTFGDTHPILKVSCTVLFSAYEALKDESVLSDAVRGLAESLREMVHSALECPDLPVIEGTENVIEAIGRVSMQIACLIDEYVSLPSAIRSVRDALSDDMKARVGLFQARCADLRRKFNDRMNLDTHKTVHQIRNGQIADQLEMILTWLKSPDPSRNFNSARATHQEGTGHWFINGKEFSEWKEHAGQLLWVYGIPGCGKTILSSSAIKEVTTYCATNTSFAVAYFFFDSRDAQDDLQRHEGLVRCLIKQLLLQCDEIPDGLEKLLSRGHAQPSEDSLHAALKLLLAKFEHTYVIVDSLDECTERSNVLGWLQRITHDQEAIQHNLHILVTSRDELDIRQCLESLGVVQVCIQGKSVEDDIRNYIDHTLRTGFRIKKWNDATKAEIRENVLAVSGGMFRLAVLQLEELRNCFNLRALKKRLGRLPRSLYETYDRILSKLDEENRRTAFKILQWLAFSARLPLLNELTEVLAIDLDTEPHPRFCDELQYGSEDVLIICSNLIVISTQGYVQLAHLSVKEYILTSTSLQNWGLATNEKLSHSLIAQTCLAYLLRFDTLQILNEETLDDFPLAQYAAEHWVFHTQSAAGDSATDPVQILIHTLFTGNSAPFISWVRLDDIDNPGSKRDMTRMPVGSRLYYACLAGLQDISQALLDAGTDPNVKGLDNVTVLQVASRSGQYRTVQRLLEEGAEVNKEGGWFGPALKLASFNGHYDIVRLLLNSGADVNMQGNELDNSRALQAASQRGHEGIVRLLLENGADMNLRGGVSGSALQAAARGGHEDVVRLLLDNGAEVDIRGGMYGTALHDASEYGHMETVRLLLGRGANVDMRGGPYNTALQAASQGGHEDIVRLLLENGADVGKLGGRYGSVLQAAASGGERTIRETRLKLGAQGKMEAWHDDALPVLFHGSHANIVRLLLEKGAQINVPLGGDHGSALRAASSEGFEEIVQLLLERGAEVNAENEIYGTPLQAAALEGHIEIVRLLLENGAEVNMPKEPDGSALQAAAYGGHEGIVRLLLEKGAQLNKQSENHGDALQAASLGGHEPITRLLLDQGAEVNKRSERHGDALRVASLGGHESIVRLLLEKGADINQRGGMHGDALQAASKGGHEHIVRLLLDKGADVHVRGVGLYGSALQAASKKKHLAIVELLLEKGAMELDDNDEGAR